MKNLLIALFIVTSALHAQSWPKNEFRGVWVATVSNIDWPSSKTLMTSQQRTEYITLIDRHKLNNINVAVVQVRPSCDAFYPSSIEPWSEWLMGNQGQAPSPFYDPLQFMIDETHKRGIEFHAWFNPYRAVVSTSSSSVSSSHISVTKPQWILTYGTLKILNPGIPEVRNYVISVIMDVVRRYDIDGVHFDDYFYPYPQSGQVLRDTAAFNADRRGFTNINDWRRDNVNLLIRNLNDSIHAVKPWVKFGISPFGIWRNVGTDPLGSATNGLQSYDDIYADSRKWVTQGWVDYICPQIYWSIGYTVAKYEVLVPWWGNISQQRHFVVGQAAYRIGSSSPDPNFTNLQQMPNQLRLNRANPRVKGSVFFSSKSLTNNLGGFQDSLRRDFYKYPAIVPPMTWRDSIAPLAVPLLQVTGDTNTVVLNWTAPAAASDSQRPAKYVVYRFPKNITPDYSNGRYILFISAKDTFQYRDNVSAIYPKNFVYAVTGLDRFNNESAPKTADVLMDAEAETLPLSMQLEQNYPNPFNGTAQIHFTISQSAQAELAVYDMLGKRVKVLYNGFLEAGEHTAEVSSEGLSSGIYIYELRAGKQAMRKKLVCLR